MIKKSSDKLLYLRALRRIVQVSSITKLEDYVRQHFKLTLAGSLDSQVYTAAIGNNTSILYSTKYFVNFEPLPDTELAFHNEVESLRHLHYDLASKICTFGAQTKWLAHKANDSFYYPLVLEKVTLSDSLKRDYYAKVANKYLESSNQDSKKLEQELLREVYHAEAN